MGFADGPGIGARFFEGHLAEALCEACGFLRHGYLRLFSRRRVAVGRDLELEAVFGCPGAADQVLQDLDLALARLAVGVRKLGGLHQVAVGISHQVALTVVDHHDRHGLVGAVIGHAVDRFAAVGFLHGPLIGARLGELHLAEALRIVRGVLRHGHCRLFSRRRITHRRDLEFKAVFGCPGTATQGLQSLDFTFAGCAVVVLECCGLDEGASLFSNQSALAVVLDNDGHGLVRSVIGDAVNGLTLVGFRYGPGIGSRFGEGHLAEALRVVRGILRHGYLRLFSCRCTVHRRDRELEAVVCRPFTADQSLQNLDLALAALAVGVFEFRSLDQGTAFLGHQVALAVVHHFDRHGLIIRVIGDTVDGLALMGLADGPGVGARLGEGHPSEALRVVRRTLRHGHRVFRGRRCAFRRCDRELEAVFSCPVAAGEGLLHLDLALAALAVGIRKFCGLEQGASFFSDQVSLAVVLHDDRHGPVRTVIGDAVNGIAFMGFCHGPLIRARFGEGHLAEALRVVRGILGHGYS